MNTHDEYKTLIKNVYMKKETTRCDLQLDIWVYRGGIINQNCYFYSYVDSIYHSKLEINDTIESSSSVYFLEICWDIDCNLTTTF